MCIRVENTSQIKEWTGWKWRIKDEKKLALLIAHVAIGQAAVAESIIRNTEKEFDKPNWCMEGAKRLLKFGTINSKSKLVTTKVTKRNTRRDGWLFQIISWIASHQIYKNYEIVRPHVTPYKTGPDGLIIKCDCNDPAKLIICEEKASENPRGKITSEVWPEFKKFDSGIEDFQLFSIALTRLSNKFGGDDDLAHKVVNETLGKKRRAFRISVTVDESFDSNDQRKKLFKGYDKNVSCDYKDRYAETLIIDNLECDMERIAQLAVKKIEEWEDDQNV